MNSVHCFLPKKLGSHSNLDLNTVSQHHCSAESCPKEEDLTCNSLAIIVHWSEADVDYTLYSNKKFCSVCLFSVIAINFYSLNQFSGLMAQKNSFSVVFS